MKPRPAIRPERLEDRLAAFAAIGATAKGGVDRQALTPGDRTARRLLFDLARERGFTVTQDAAANLFVRREGADPSLPPLLLGSHLDTQPTGGRFDGALGVLAGFEVLEALEDAGTRTKRAIELVAWTNEEGSRFAPGCLGSQAFVAGRVEPAWEEARSPDGARLGDELAATLAALPEAEARPLGTRIAAYLELHIEQGPVLEREGVLIGAVTGIQGTRWLEISVEGAAAHAGTTPLAFRRDPMIPAVTLLQALQAEIMPEDAEARLTAGRIRAEPGSINAIPERVVLSLDIRHPDPARLEAIEARIRALGAEAAETSGCRFAATILFDMPALAFPAEMIGIVEQAAEAAGLASRRIVSGAFHDALFVARTAPSAMIFVPCRDGISHNEAEDVEPRFALAGARALLEAALAIADAPAPAGRPDAHA